jgi:hypothetical protein
LRRRLPHLAIAEAPLREQHGHPLQIGGATRDRSMLKTYAEWMAARDKAKAKRAARANVAKRA